MVLEMGLHRRQSLITNFLDPADREDALVVFWSVYCLDRRWSLGTGLSFAIVDRDVDPELPDLVCMSPPLQVRLLTQVLASTSSLPSVACRLCSPLLQGLGSPPPVRQHINLPISRADS